MIQDAQSSASHRSLAALIAWLSVCLLVAGMGPLVQPQIRELWTRIGALGLAASVAFEITARARHAARARRQRLFTQRRIEKCLNRLSMRHSTLKMFGAALRQIGRSRKKTAGSSDVPSREPRLPFTHPVRVQSLVSGQPIPPSMPSDAPVAHVKSISPNGVRLLHDQPFGSRRVILEFELPHGGMVRLLAELRWQRVLPDGKYHSGGILIKVIKRMASIDATAKFAEVS